MSNKNSNLDLIQSAQDGKEITQNDLNCAFSPASLFALRPKTTASLTWGYYGGTLTINNVSHEFAPSTILLTNNATNYIQLNHATASVEVNQTAFGVNTDFTPIYEVIVTGGVISDWTDKRSFFKTSGSDSYSLPTASTTVKGGVKVDGTTIIMTGEVISAAPVTSGVSQIIAGSNITITPTGGTGAVTINATGGGSSPVATAEVFSVTAKTGLTATIQGGRCANIGSKGFYNSVNAVQNLPNITVTLPANSSGYVVYRSGSGGSIGYVTLANLGSEVCQTLYYFVTGASTITTFDDVRGSFTNFNMYNPVYECIQTSWAVSSSYSFSPNFSDLNTLGSSWNILPRRIQFYCITAELGYSAGNITHAVTNEPSIVIAQNNVRILTQSALPQVMNRTTLGTISTITPANWKILLVVEPIM